MKIALISDIHGNLDALKVVLHAAENQGVDQMLFAGDLLGYYYQPAECLSLLNSWSCKCVKGNHEDLFFALLADSSLAESLRLRYGSALSRAVKTLNTEQVQLIQTWPETLALTVDGVKILLCHGSPWQTDCYIYPDSELNLLERCAETGFDYVVLGHTHYPMHKSWGNTQILNPGSVGQPRNRKPGASWGLLDTFSGTYHVYTETYSTAAIQAQTQQWDPHLPYLWEVLERT